ncbi:MAG: phosphohydrolase, partial [Caldilinea sp.]|nr:phosphohydrolase [Caldilinea sp.]
MNKRSEEQLNAMVNPNGSDLTVNGYRLVTVDDLKRDAESIAMLQAANATMKALGYTEHGQRHAGLVGNIAQNV